MSVDTSLLKVLMSHPRLLMKDLRSILPPFLAMQARYQAASEKSVPNLVRREHTQEFVGDARAEHREVGEDYLLSASEPGLGADDVSGSAGREEAADSLAHRLRRGACAAHLAEEGGDLVGLQQDARTLDERVFKCLAGREGLGDGLAEVHAGGKARVGLSRGVLADAAFPQHDEIEVRVGPVFVGVVAPGEVRQHRQRAGERKNAIGAGASRHGPVRELVYEARHMSQRLRHRAGVVKALVARSAFST